MPRRPRAAWRKENGTPWSRISRPSAGCPFSRKAREAFPEAVRIGVVPFQPVAGSASLLRAPGGVRSPGSERTGSGAGALLPPAGSPARRAHLPDRRRTGRASFRARRLPAPGGKPQQPDTSIGEIAEIIEGDVGTSARLLQLVNSVIFRTSREIVTVKMAASFLGLNVIKNVVLSMEAFQAFQKIPSVPGFSLDELQAHCRLTAAIAATNGASRGRARRRHRRALCCTTSASSCSLTKCRTALRVCWPAPRRNKSRCIESRKSCGASPTPRWEPTCWGCGDCPCGSPKPSPTITRPPPFRTSASTPSRRSTWPTCWPMKQEGTRGRPSEWDLAFLEGLGVRPRLAGWKTMAREVACAQPGIGHCGRGLNEAEMRDGPVDGNSRAGQLRGESDAGNLLKVLIGSGEGLLKKNLTRWGYEVTVVSDGNEALALLTPARPSQAGHPQLRNGRLARGRPLPPRCAPSPSIPTPT